MKITKLEVIKYKMENAMIPWALVKVHTDEGVTGYGEPVLEGRVSTVETAVYELGDYIIGKDPRDIERNWQLMYKGSFYRGGPIMSSAVSGVEQALWDIAGKWYDVPAYQLMGGRVRDKIRMYAWIHGKTLEELIAAIKMRKAQGFNAVKVLAFPTEPRYIDTPAKLQQMADNFGALRETVGNSMDIGIDLHGRFSPAMAKLFIKATEEYNPMFYEEPVIPGNDDVMADIARRTHIPIATGERLFTRWGYKDIIEKRAADILQPDVCHAGGILELKKIAAMGEVNFCGLAPHNPMGAVALASSLQVDTSTINFFIQEHSVLGEGIIKNPFVVEDGFVKVPEGPGLGIEVDEESIRAHASEGREHMGWSINPDDNSYMQDN